MSKLIDYIRSTWHEVPDDVTIPEGVEFAAVWNSGGAFATTAHADDFYRVPGSFYTRFTPEPLPEPDFELPTTPGALIIAHDSEDETRRAFMRTATSSWADSEGFYRDDMLLDPQPAIVIPNGIGVMDETDKRDRVDADGALWKFHAANACWFSGDDGDRVYGTLATLDCDYGPLRFADEEAQR